MGFEEKHELAVRKGGTSAKLVIAVMVLQVVVSIFMVL